MQGTGRDEVTVVEQATSRDAGAGAATRTSERRASEKHLRFLLRLSDLLRPLDDPEAIQFEAARALGEHLGASRVGYAEADPDGVHLHVARNYTSGVRGAEGRYRIDDYGPTLLPAFGAGRTVVLPDIADDPSLSDATKAAYAALELGAMVNVPLVKGGRLVAVLFMHHTHARAYDDAEVSLLESVAERTWDAVVRARAEAALRASEQRFRLMADAVPTIVWITDHEGRAEFFNRQWSVYTGTPSHPESAAAATAGFVHPDDVASTMDAFAEARRAGGVYSVEHRIRSAAGEYRWFLVRAEPHRDAESGEIVRWFGTSIDIHDRRQMEAALREGEARSRLALDIAELGTWTWDLATGAGDMDARGAEIVGLPAGPLDDVAAAQLASIHPDDLAATQAAAAAGVASGEPFSLDYRVVRPDGGVRYVASRAHVVRDAAGRPLRLVGTNRDVTAERETQAERERLFVAEHEARERAERLQALTEALAGAPTMDDVATVVVAEMVVALGARTGALSARVPDGEALALVRQVGFPPAAAERVARQPIDSRGPVPECFRTAAPVWVERRDGADGFDARYPALAVVWDRIGVAAGAYMPLVAAGEAVGVISFGFAEPRVFAPAERAFLLALGRQAALAMERARLFEAERAARREAESANRAKGEFLAVMSHELRTPLNAIGGYAELIELGLRGPVTEQQRADLARIQASQRHLLGLINQVLNYTRVDAGAVRYDVADVPVGEALAAAEALVIPQVRARGLSYALGGVPPGLAVRADREKLQQILLNLLSNAVKFTEPGGELRVTCEPLGDVVAIAVADTGIGIAPEKLASIFEPFVQVDQRLTRSHEGVGLGLAISRDLARGMGGDLTARSAPGAGSTFTLTVPRA